MGDKITVSNFLNKYKCVSRSEILRRIHDNSFSSFLKGKTYYINEEETKTFFKIPNINFNDFLKLSESRKMFNVSSKSLLDYVRKGDIEAYIILNKWYLKKSDIENIIETVNKNKSIRPRDDSRVDEFNNIIKSKLGDEYTVLRPYRREKENILLRHNICGFKYFVHPSNIIHRKNPTKCPNCFGTRAYTDKEVEELINLSSNGNYSYVYTDTPYKNNKSYITLRHNNPNCKGKNAEYKTKLNDFLYGYGRCPFCNMSSGEETIFTLLSKKNINFEFQKYENFGDNRHGFFDFYFDNIIIEFDGEQHFLKESFYDFNDTAERDHNKNIFVSNHADLKMIRISYKNLKNLDVILNLIIENNFNRLRDYPLGEYEQVLGNSVILAENIYYIG